MPSAVRSRKTQVHTGQHFLDRVFWGGSAADRRQVAEGFLFEVMSYHPAVYRTTVTSDAIRVDMSEWPDNLEFPSRVWSLFRKLGVEVQD